MFASEIPGHVIHIRMDGEHAIIYFENAPLSLVTTDVSGALEAFNLSDWSYFNRRWWQDHDYLLAPSPVLARLAATINPDQVFSASDLLEMAVAEGYYENLDPQAVEWDRDRLQVLAQAHECFKLAKGLIQQEGKGQVLAWPGSIWAFALMAAHEREQSHRTLTSV